MLLRNADALSGPITKRHGKGINKTPKSLNRHFRIEDFVTKVAPWKKSHSPLRVDSP